MDALKARVVNGRLVMNEPTDLPEGEEVNLVVADDWGEMSEEERAELDRALEESIAQAKAGQLVDAEVVMAELRSRRAAPAYAKGKGTGE